MNGRRLAGLVVMGLCAVFALIAAMQPAVAEEEATGETGVPAKATSAESTAPDKESAEAQAADVGGGGAGEASAEEADKADIEGLLKVIDVGPYEVPKLVLKKDNNYAYSATDVEPFRHVTPYKEHFLEQMEYTGPGRAIPEPEHVDTVKIGFIGPIMGTVSVATGGKSHEESLGIPMLRGAQLAIEQANERGGYLKRNIPFELVIANDNGLWGASGNEIIKLAYKHKVWAILGTIDGANSHIAIRVALKAEIAMMNSGDTDPTFIETNIPWVFRCIGDDRQMGYLLVDYLYRKLEYTRLGIVRASNRYGRFGVREIRDGSRRLGHPVILEMAYKVGIDDFSLQLQRMKASNVEAVVHWGDAIEGAKLLNQMRAMGMEQPYYACDRCVSDEFLEIAGENAEGVVCAYPWNPARPDEDCDAFRKAYAQRFNEEPGTYAAHAFDGMNMLIWGIQTAGLNRAKIRDVLAHRVRPYKGATGLIPLSACLDDLGEVFLTRVENGEWRFYSREDWSIPQGTIAPRDRVSRKTASAQQAGESTMQARTPNLPRPCRLTDQPPLAAGCSSRAKFRYPSCQPPR
ncbi:MAG: ABC transporter substrate-binding protein [Phycisphaerae bacterium]|nr:ABC transporter substrate-binding protein [Phycisphaerae bacterium]